jgi:hypothetical protein
MTETGLIVAEVAFLVLLYAFVWTVVRSASRQIPSAPQPPPAPAPEAEPQAASPRAERREVAMASAPSAPSAPQMPPAPPLPPPVEIPQPTAEPLGAPPEPAPEPAGDASEDRTRGAAALGIPPEGVRLDLAANLDPRLVVETSPSLATEREIPLEGGLTIGRSEAAGLSIADQFVSHMHARILRRGPYHFVEDLGSTNGTFLNDRRVERDAQLKVHDSLRIGQTILRYEE